MNCQTDIQLKIQDVIRFSGHYFSQIGSYQSCISTSNMLYNLLSFYNTTNKQPAGISWGLCLPQSCHQQYLQNTINYYLSKAEAPYYVGQIQNNNIQDIKYPFTWLFFFTIILITLILIMTVISTVFQRQTKTIKVLKEFNLRQSIKILTTKDHNLNVLNGVRSLAMIWVILGHNQSFRITFSTNIATVDSQVQTIYFLFVEAGMIAVDIFFFLGGLLVAYSLLKYQQNNTISKYLLAIVHRILRIWPCYIIAILIYYSVFIHFGKGPLWSQQQPTIQFCSKMWKPLFFVDNLVDNGQEMCLGWGWYLQNDMQLFVISLIIFSFGFLIKKRIVQLLLILLIIGSVTFTFWQVLIHNYIQPTKLSDFILWGEYMADIYIKPWSRCPPYFYGLIFGIAYSKYEISVKQKSFKNQLTFFENVKLKLSKSRKARLFCELFGIGVMVFIILIPRTIQFSKSWPQWIMALYLSTNKLIFVIALSLTLLPSMIGLNSFVKFCLDTKLLNFIAKISFCTYLVHLMVIYRTYYNQSLNLYYTQSQSFPLFLFHLALSLAFGLLMTLLIEVPFSKVEKQIVEFVKNKFKINKQKNQGSQQSLSDIEIKINASISTNPLIKQ